MLFGCDFPCHFSFGVGCGLGFNFVCDLGFKLTFNFACDVAFERFVALPSTLFVTLISTLGWEI
jgi:hypothetical protein